MSFDRAALLQAVNTHGPVVRVVITGFSGSAPRETGTSMLVWRNGQQGTIGGGALEFEATRSARKLAASDTLWQRSSEQHALGPSLGQCCGGSVNLLLERFSQTELETLPESGLYARPVATTIDPAEVNPPLSVTRILREARSGQQTSVIAQDGYFIENINAPNTPLWIYGAGHVGRALVRVLEGLDFDVTWIDETAERFPDTLPPHINRLIAANPADAVIHAPANAVHLVLTYSHTLDLEICHRVLARQFGHLGLIGSATKRARFLSRLHKLRHSDAILARLDCPIGNKALGKHPTAIALGVAQALIEQQRHVPARLNNEATV